MPEILVQPKNKDAIKKYNNTYYTKNKVKLLEDALKKIECDVCKKSCTKSNFSKHLNTDKHKLNAKIKELEK